MKKKILILSSLFVFFVVALTPASLINIVMPPQKNLSIHGVKGSIWSGDIDQITVAGKQLKQVKFAVNPFVLMMAKLSLDLDIKKGDVLGDLNIVLGSDYAQNIQLNDANLNVTAAMFQNYLPITGVEIGGEIVTSNLNVKVENKKLVIAEGLLSWKRAAITFSGQEWQLGDFVVDASTDEKTNVISGKLLKSQNKLDLKGKFSLDSKGMFEFIGDISIDSEQALYQAFALFNNGKPAKGRLPIKFKQKIL